MILMSNDYNQNDHTSRKYVILKFAISMKF